MIRHRRFLACVSLALLAWTLGAVWFGHTCRTGCAAGSCGDHHSATVADTGEDTVLAAKVCPACLLARHLQTVDARIFIGDLPTLVVHPLTPSEPASEDLVWAVTRRSRGPPAS
jgi:hypothetical protein